MLVYRDSWAKRQTLEWLQQLVWRARNEGCTPEAARDLCIEFGELEAAIADHVCERTDACTPLTRALRRTGAELAATFLAAFERDAARAADCLLRARRALESLGEHELPSSVQAKVPEGFAYYGLYPEQYLQAAELALRHCEPERVVVLGLRSIGTTLSSVVEAYVARRVGHVVSYVVRPRGQPFARTLGWEPALQAELQAETGAHFFIVDEGPGLSGSSLTCVALALRQLGVPRSRIAFLPSYRCDGANFVNELAKQTWQEHAHFAGDFQPIWLADISQGAELRDLSSGAWQREFGVNSQDVAYHPQHERRKYLALQTDGSRFMLRFAGLGSHGRRARARAEALEPSGVTPRVLDFRDGMLSLEHIAGSIGAIVPASPEFIAQLAEYLAFRGTRLQVDAGTDLQPLLEMARQNLSEAFGPSACEPLAALALAASASERRAIIADGRMLPHEWLATATGIRKVDVFDHGDDHFYPGPCDIAWDVAGAICELELGTRQRQVLLSCYETATADSTIAERLPFYELAYLAHRLGYAAMAARSLASTSAGTRFEKLEHRYRRALWARLREQP